MDIGQLPQDHLQSLTFLEIYHANAIIVIVNKIGGGGTGWYGLLTILVLLNIVVSVNWSITLRLN